MLLTIANFFAAFLTTMATIAMAVFAWRIPMILREEKYKEILYGRKFTIYDELLLQIPTLFYLAAAFQHGTSTEQRILHEKELLDHLVKFKMTIEGTSHLLPEQFHVECISIYKLLRPEELEVSFPSPLKALEAWVEIVNIARSDQAVEKLTKSITDTLGQGYYPDSGKL